MDVFAIAQMIGKLLDLFGVMIILAGVIYATGVVAIDYVRSPKLDHLYALYRKMLGRSILLGLEFLVAGDIIRSITGTPDFTSVGVLAIIVIIRSFLAITFEMEVDGRWPWQKR